MTYITQAILAEAVIALQGMGAQEQLQLADEIFARQPNMLGSVIVLRRLGASDAQIGVAVHVLLVSWLAMKRCEAKDALKWPVISEDLQDQCLQRLTARVRFTEGMPVELQRQAAQQYTDTQGERYLLAYVHGHLRDQGLLDIKSEAEKYVLLCALNLVECIASSRPKTRR
ncbi:MAG: hypothetical protein PSV17_06435 [Methylotenera sp.]|uniref:hypothetical protein n=1 Tax=Methylotenera sp. TaxID=2051956 RepID=UPI002487E5C7|nr:hypothetical protein [Methylotenera sp.]MDI1309058.1 hypothetical protein [Methylotenera sp.]